MTTVRIERDVTAFGDEHAVRLTNGDVEVVITTGFGPRILSYRYQDGPNALGYLDPREQSKPTPFGDAWHIYGGHRLWHAPEHPDLSYVPDNVPVRVTVERNAVVVTRPLEVPTLLVKEMRIALAEAGSRVEIEHRITNQGTASIELAVWALTMMAPGGTAIFPNAPFVPYPEGLLPVRRLVLWPYTDLGDPRFRFGSRYLRLRHDTAAKAPQKIGIFDETNGWAAYACDDWLFLKRYAPSVATTPLVDLGCNVESFSDAKVIEVETLGPQLALAPGTTATHYEAWHLFRGVNAADDDDALGRTLDPILAGTTSA